MPDRQGLMLPWAVVGIMFVMLMAMLVICHLLGNQLQQPLPEDQRLLVRTILYSVAIVTFPLTNLIRHIQLRLNQTMPFSSHHNLIVVVKNRYLMTTLISMALIETPAIYGFVMFILGDTFNTLYIFTGMSALGLFLYRPKIDEFNGIIEALTHAKR